jgi:hypothetical protein
MTALFLAIGVLLAVAPLAAIAVYDRTRPRKPN